MSENFKFNQNRDCEYFPCHKGVPEEEFNCLFCYCPLFMLQDECGGNYGTGYGVKDCSGCTKPHDKNGYEFIRERMGEVVQRGSAFINK